LKTVGEDRVLQSPTIGSREGKRVKPKTAGGQGKARERAGVGTAVGGEEKRIHTELPGKKKNG